MSDGGFEIRDTDGGKLLLRAHASVFNVWYPVGSFEEQVRPGTFRRTIGEDCDTVLLQDHRGAQLARTRAPDGKQPTLRLSEDARGLLYEAELDPALERVRDVRWQAENCGLQSSFGFFATGDSWSDDGSKRELTQASLHRGDVTLCAFGANDATAGVTIDPRSALSEAERRALKGGREVRACPAFDVPILGEARGRYAGHQLAELGKKGEAFGNVDGHWSFPTADRHDLENAIRSVGRSGASHDAVRRYIIGRAQEMKLPWLIPSNWQADGSLSGAGRSLDLGAASAEIAELRSRRSPLARREIEAGMTGCPNCEGEGMLEGKRCPVCAGSGEVPSDMCEKCSGTGENDGEPCAACEGTGTESRRSRAAARPRAARPLLPIERLQALRARGLSRHDEIRFIRSLSMGRRRW